MPTSVLSVSAREKVMGTSPSFVIEPNIMIFIGCFIFIPLGAPFECFMDEESRKYSRTLYRERNSDTPMFLAMGLIDIGVYVVNQEFNLINKFRSFLFIYQTDQCLASELLYVRDHHYIHLTLSKFSALSSKELNTLKSLL